MSTSPLEITPEHKAARSAGSIAFADQGPSNSTILLFASTDGTGTPLVTIKLAKPCGTVVAGSVVFAQDDPAGDMILISGAALSGLWVNGAGVVMGRGTVTDEAGDGHFKVRGTTGTMLYAGASAQLGVTAVG